MYRIGKYIIDSRWFSHAITVILLMLGNYSEKSSLHLKYILAVQYINFSEKKLIQTEPAHVSDRIKDTNDPDMNFLIFQQSRMEKEINNLRHELGKSSMISMFNLFFRKFRDKVERNILNGVEKLLENIIGH